MPSRRKRQLNRPNGGERIASPGARFQEEARRQGWMYFAYCGVSVLILLGCAGSLWLAGMFWETSRSSGSEATLACAGFGVFGIVFWIRFLRPSKLLRRRLKCAGEA